MGQDSVTSKIRYTKQPYGGYLPIKDFSKISLTDNKILHEKENIHAVLVGIAVDYLTRYMATNDKKKAFTISLVGAYYIDEKEKARSLFQNITGLDDLSIISACKLVGFDTVYRAGDESYVSVDEINPNSETIENIRSMVLRGIDFLKNYGPMTKDGFTFEGGYTSTVIAGDGDFLTRDTLWEFKVLRKAPDKNHTLQLLMYYLMGMRSNDSEDFKNITRLGIFNPRLHKVYLLDLTSIESSIIEEVSSKVIGY